MELYTNVSPPRKDLTGQMFERLTVKEFVGRDKVGCDCWKCVCRCGKERIVLGRSLRSKNTRSCGCLAGIVLEKKVKHGFSSGFKRSKVYTTWASMIGRCYNPNNPCYNRYGGRGITVCPRWRQSFMDFYTDIGGEIPKGMQIDRIDNNGNYEPGNIRLATRKEQANNRRDNRIITINNVSRTLAEWCRHLNTSYSLVCRRVLRDGWSVERGESCLHFLSVYFFRLYHLLMPKPQFFLFQRV